MNAFEPENGLVQRAFEEGGYSSRTKQERNTHWEVPRRKFQTVHRLSISNYK